MNGRGTFNMNFLLYLSLLALFGAKLCLSHGNGYTSNSIKDYLVKDHVKNEDNEIRGKFIKFLHTRQKLKSST